MFNYFIHGQQVERCYAVAWLKCKGRRGLEVTMSWMGPVLLDFDCW